MLKKGVCGIIRPEKRVEDDGMRKLLGLVILSMLIGLVIHVAATNVVSVAANIERGDSQNSNAAMLNWMGESSAKYTVQKSLDLSGNSWSNLAVDLPGVDGMMTVTNDFSEPQAFFQVLADTNTVPEVDPVPPMASVTFPADQATVSGTITVEVSAFSTNGIKKVGLYIDDAWIVTDQGAPYDFDVDTTTLSDGSHLIKVRAVDLADNAEFSSSITVIVDNSTVDVIPPTVSLTSPVDQETVSGTITVKASASTSPLPVA